MTTIDVTCRCGRVLKAPLSAAGKKGRCKACGTELRIPDVADSAYAVATPAVSSPFVPMAFPTDDHSSAVYLPVTVDSDAKKTPGSARADDESVPGEPWYYRFLEIYAKAIMLIGLIVCSCWCFFGIIVWAIAMASDAQGGSKFGLIAAQIAAAWGILTQIPVMDITAPILLVVDLARNIRAIRFMQAAREGSNLNL